MLTHRARDHVDTRFYSAQDLASAVGLHERRRVEAGNEWAGAGRVTEKQECSRLVQVQFFIRHG